jgi:hypothetical protein
LIADRLFPYLERYEWVGVGPQEWVFILEHLYGFVGMGLKQFSRNKKVLGGYLPKARQVVISERGCKVRMVTPVSGSVSYFAMLLNGFLLHLLDKDDRTCREASFESSKVFASFNPRPEDLVRSVDMKAATDLIPFGVAKALVGGLCSGMGLSPFLEQTFLMSINSYVITPLKGEGTPFVSSSGVLMGVGVSWPLLCLYNLWLWDGAFTELGFRPCKAVRGKVRVVGDDLLGLATLQINDLYTLRLRRTGGEISQGKDFISRSAGVLCEELVVIRPVMGNETDFPKVIPTYSVREVQPEGRLTGRDDTPPYCMGPALCRVHARMGEAWFLTFVKFRYSETFNRLKHRGIIPCLPREFGGAGFPVSSVRDVIASLRSQCSRALRCAMSQGDTGLALLSSYSSCWTDTFSQVLPEGSALFLKSCQLESIHSIGEVLLEPGAVHPTVGELLNTVVAVAEAAQRLVVSSPSRKVPLTLATVKKRLDRATTRLDGLVPYPKLTDSPKNLTDGLYKFLNEGINRRVHSAAGIPLLSTMSIVFGGGD